jgi:hypothetical protein
MTPLIRRPPIPSVNGDRRPRRTPASRPRIPGFRLRLDIRILKEIVRKVIQHEASRRLEHGLDDVKEPTISGRRQAGANEV